MDITLSPEMMTALMLALVIVGIFMGFPIAFTLAGVGFITGILLWGPRVYGMCLTRTYTIMKEYVLLAVPGFVFMGVMLERSGAAERLYGTLHVVMGGLRGGLAMATIVICTIFAAATGIIGASVVAMGLLALPSMVSRGYNKAIAAGSVCAGGTLGILIPPSIMIVLYAPTAGISLGKLFAAAFMPGFLLAGLYLLYVGITCGLNPHWGPPLPVEERRAIPTRLKVTRTMTHLLPPLVLILAVLGAIFAGIATPTEAAFTGAFASMFIAMAYRRFNWQTLKESLYGTLRISSFILFIAACAGTFAGVFMHLGGGKVITELLLAAPGGAWGAFAIMQLLVFIMGMLMDWVGSLFIIVPLFTPVAAALGWGPEGDLNIWFAMTIIINYQTSFLTPPFAYAIFYLKGVAPPEVTVADIIKGIFPFVGLILVGLTLCIIFKPIILWLPSIIVAR
ncbi:MAG TPA: TRAP transporter large permease subunit [Dehalococcoidia bacterium]|nr:TRAP transporter large permease subunit [Dehalococcoidia bacterium]